MKFDVDTMFRKSATTTALPTANLNYVPLYPTVNVLPQSVMDVVGLASLKRRFVIAAGAGALVMGVVFLAQTAQISVAKTNLADETGRTDKLIAQYMPLVPVKTYYAGVAANTAVIRATMAKEVYFSSLVTMLSNSVPADFAVGEISFNVDTTPGAGNLTSCPGTDPFSKVRPIGCISFSAVAPSRKSVGAFLNTLSTENLLTNPYVSSTSVDNLNKVSFNITIGITENAFSKRYTDPTFLKATTTP